MAQAELSGAVVAVAVLLVAGSASVANECAGLPRGHSLASRLSSEMTDFSVCVFKVPSREIPHLSHGQVSLGAVMTPSIAGFFHSWGFFSAQSVKAWTIAP